MKSLIYLIAVCVLSCILVSCDNMYSIHEKYLSEGERVYIGYPDVVKAQGGYKRIQLVWKLNADPRIDRCCIYWQDRSDSLIVAPDRTDTVMRQIIPLPEGKYLFEMINKDEEGNSSLTKVIAGESYGDSYQENLFSRIVTDQIANPDSVILTWGLEEKCIGVNMQYVNNIGETKQVFLEGEQTQMILKDFVPGGSFVYNSLFNPEIEGIDTIPSKDSEDKFISFYELSKEDWENQYHDQYTDIDRSAWTVTASTEELSGEGKVNGRAATILDGDLNTYWHSQWKGSPIPALPHTLDIDMKEVQTISSIELVRRKGNKDTKEVVFSISMDGQKWDEIGSLSYPATGGKPDSKIILLPKPIQGRYMKLTVVASNSNPQASIAEVMFTQSR